MRGVVLLAALASAFLPLAAAQSTEGARVEPAVAAPGETLHLLYTTPSPGVLDVAVQRSVACTITGPDGATTDCSPETTLVVVHVAPGATSYTWQVPAPSAYGNYTVTFQETAVLAVPGAAPSAQATFEVSPRATADGQGADEPLTPGSTDETPGNGTFRAVIYHLLLDPAGRVREPEPAAAQRFVASSTLSASSLILLVLATRFGGAP